MGQTGLAGSLPMPSPAYVNGKLDTALSKGALVRENASGLLVQAADGEDVFGVLAASGEASANVPVQIGGVVRIATTGSPGFTQRYQSVVCAGSNQIDSGTAGDPDFGSVIFYDSGDSTADVLLRGTAQRAPARSLFDRSSMTSFPVDSLSADRYLAVTGGKIITKARSGATGSRPGTPFTGQAYFDSTLGVEMTYNGTRWQSAHRYIAQFWSNSRTTAITTTTAVVFQNDSSDAEMPWVVPKSLRIVGCRYIIKGGTGGKTWTARLRLDGSGSDTWTSTARSSSTSWVGYDETIDQALSADQRVTIIVNQGGAAETLRSILYFEYYWT